MESDPCSDEQAVPILQVGEDFLMKGNTNCSRTQFLLVVSYTITIHKSQSVTMSREMCDISECEFAMSLSYVAISQVSRLDALMMDVPFDLNHDLPTKVMQVRVVDYDSQWRNKLLEPLYQPHKEELNGNCCN